MLKIAVIGSNYFQSYLRQIQDDHRFPDVELLYISDRLGIEDEVRFRLINEEIGREEPQALVMGTYDYIKISPQVDIPCYVIQPAIQDLMLIHPLIEDYTRTVLLLSHKDNIDIQTLEHCLKIKYNQVYYEHRSEIPSIIHKLKTQGIETVISNRSGVKYALEEGMTAHYYYSHKTLEDGINNTIQIIRNLEREQSRLSEVRSILDSVSCGAIHISGNEPTIRYINRTALSILRRKNGDFMHRPLTQCFPKHVCELIRNCYEPTYDVSFSLCGMEVIANIVPMDSTLSNKDVYLLFEKTASIFEKESAIRQSLRRQKFNTKYTFNDIKGENPILKKAIGKAKRFATTDATIFIHAETGAGKEVFAQSIHDYSHRREYPFIAINCASIPDTLIESELFGYMPGSFTGASNKGKQGLIELANHGTVFLDDVDGLSYNFQAKLLRMIQEREIIRIGGDTPIPVDVRFIVASNRDLKEMVENGLFRNDLYFRINVLPLNIPPLRERKEDILPLYEYYISLFDYEFYNKIKHLVPVIFRPALAYSYPGNVRELVNISERFKSLVDTARYDDIEYLSNLVRECLDMNDVQEENSTECLKMQISGNYTEDLHQAERSILQYYLDNSNCNMTELAKKLNISRATLYSKMRNH